MELSNAGSLQVISNNLFIFLIQKNLLETVGNLPERAIKSLARQVLKGLNSLHAKLKTSHGVLDPSQILFERNGNVKVNN